MLPWAQAWENTVSPVDIISETSAIIAMSAEWHPTEMTWRRQTDRQGGGWIVMTEGSLVGKLTIKTGVRNSCRAAKANIVFMVHC